MSGFGSEEVFAFLEVGDVEEADMIPDVVATVEKEKMRREIPLLRETAGLLKERIGANDISSFLIRRRLSFDIGLV